ncbi:prephenate dehydratase [Kordia algicida OT-1]|uniref:prephenate dehydratase n=1 Tax=Kordia algicida OT-1 TaxID=391587 RepID=A9DJC6_9FLAO|nr:prephenate dehydratase [Kordia algicida]EDP98074.1 putative prefrenate dehydratase [Kordia algicida OT-1]
MKQTIAIQGIQGSNHHKVAQAYFGNEVQLDECLSFDALIASLLQEKSEYAIMAIENTIAGSIIPNYALIDANNIHINGEFYLNIQHQLMALPNQTIQDINEVCSHPMALLQCKEFFKQYPHIKLVEDVDTAAVAQRIQEQKRTGIAAIATKMAAELFELEILSGEIQTIKTNMTRFVILQKQQPKNGIDQIDKASLRFELDHKRGSLATVLNVMSDCKLNLTKIQSLPIIETPWKYAFFVDVTFENYEDYTKAISVLEIMTTSLKILGTYKNRRNA